jgi:hypothetical protein
LRTTQLNILQNADLNALAKYITSRATLFNPASSSSSGVFTVIKDLGALKDPGVLRSFGTPRVFVIPDYPTYLPDNPEDENAAFALLGGPQRALQVHLHNELTVSGKKHHATSDPFVGMTLKQFYEYAKPPFQYAMNVLDLASDTTLVPLPSPTPHFTSLHASPLAQAQRAFDGTRCEPFCLRTTPFDHKFFSWLLLSSGGTIHYQHQDAHGTSTAGMTNGIKLWFFPKHGPETKLKPGSSTNFTSLKDFHSSVYGDSGWEWEVLVQKPGILM